MLSANLKTAAVAALCTALALPAAAADHKVEIIKKTGYAITEFYGSNNDTKKLGRGYSGRGCAAA